MAYRLNKEWFGLRPARDCAILIIVPGEVRGVRQQPGVPTLVNSPEGFEVEGSAFLIILCGFVGRGIRLLGRHFLSDRLR